VQSYISVAKEELNLRGVAQKASSYFHKEKHPMRKTFAIALMLAASLKMPTNTLSKLSKT
jgi:hypothetical protein